MNDFDFSVLDGFVPDEKEERPDGFPVFKGNRNCTFSKMSIEGESVKYTLIVDESEKDSGRLIWGSFGLKNEIGVKILSTIFYNLEFKPHTWSSLEGLDAMLSQLKPMHVRVRCWYKPTDKKDPSKPDSDLTNYWQKHSIAGLASPSPISSGTVPPF